MADELCEQEARPAIALQAAATPAAEHKWDLIHRYSSLLRLLRITALCIEFKNRISRGKEHSTGTCIGQADIERARIFWIKATQEAFLQKEIRTLKKGNILPTTHPFSRPTAFIDPEGVIRAGGRLEHSELPPDSKHPAILPRQARLSELIIDDSHRRTMHGGTQLTLAHIRQLYWILGGRAPVKSHILRCVICARHRAVRAQQLLGQLLAARVIPSRAFSHTGVDYAGPLTLKTWKGRGAITSKGWICVFVCLTTTACHFEVVTDYSADGFIAAYRRFTSRRGIPTSLHSDCGTNFLGADKQLQTLLRDCTLENRPLAALLAMDGTDWKFNPPAAPHMGGKWEAMVKSLKHHFNRSIGDARLTYEESVAFLTQIECILNSGPLEPLSDDPDDVSVLTPGHFLIGSALNAVPEPSMLDVPTSRLSRWQYIQQRVHHLWKVWSSQYLQRLQAISKWHHPRNEIRVGSLVLLSDERLPPTKWPLARVIELCPGQDGHSRVVTLKTATTTLTRPISKLVLLPVTTQDQLQDLKDSSAKDC